MELDRSVQKLEKEQLRLHKEYHEKLIEYEKIRRSDQVIRFARENMAMIMTKRDDFIALGKRNKYILLQKYPGVNRKIEK